MKTKNFLVLLVSVLALALVAQTVSAFGQITSVEVDGEQVLGQTINLEPGRTIDVRITFVADVAADDVRMKAEIVGEDDVVSERFDILPGGKYVRTLQLRVPFDLDDDSNESRTLEIEVESENSGSVDEFISFTIQRVSYTLEILSVQIQPEVKAGDTFVMDVVLKNRGSHEATDTFLKVTMPELGLETRTFYGDVAQEDRGDPDETDSVERRTYVRIPANTRPGLYTVQLEAFNDDSFVQTERRILVVGAGQDTTVYSSSTSQDLALEERGEYRLTVVNRGNSLAVFNLNADAPAALDVDLSESVIVVPAGSSKTVSVFASAAEEGDYDFTVSVTSEDGTLIDQEAFVANVAGENSGNGVGQNTTVLLTVILAIIFIVLLVVLIVLLTRKPEQKEEFGETYY